MIQFCESDFSETIFQVSIADPIENIVKIDYTRSLLKNLNPIEKHVIIQVYYKNRLYKEIARDKIFRWEITAGRVSQIKSESIKKLQLYAIHQAMDLGHSQVAHQIEEVMK